MKLTNYSLKVGNRVLLENVGVEFPSSVVNHILGKNGVGKSVFAKDLMMRHPDSTVISSYSNVPFDLTFRDLLCFLRTRYEKNQIIALCGKLNVKNINKNILIRRLSDGQKQKLKLLTFLLRDEPIIIFDEVTNALDKTTTKEIYYFINQYVRDFPGKTVINITHNLSDLANIPGNYFIFEDQSLHRVRDNDQAISLYLDNR
ncbi:MAG: ABC transporter ATP-binding protein [Bilifractor sp.]|jgi:putative peptide transport system ATP-binding protein